MAQLLPKALDKLIEQLEMLPGVGRRTAERYAYDLLRGSARTAKQLSETVSTLHSKVKYCPKTFMLIDIDQELSQLYSDPTRNKQLVAVVAQPFDVVALEATGSFNGTYHVLKGLLSPIDGVTPEDLTIDELLSRITEDDVQELILATSGGMEGDTTAMYILKQLESHPKDIRFTRLAQGLPVGLDIEYADQVTLSQALKGRREL